MNENLNNNETANEKIGVANGNTVLAEVTPAMKSFAAEYSLWIITAGQKYVNALSAKFTTEDSMEIFLRDYYGKGWMG